MFQKFLSLFRRKKELGYPKDFQRCYLKWFRSSKDKPFVPMKNYTFLYKPKEKHTCKN